MTFDGTSRREPLGFVGTRSRTKERDDCDVLILGARVGDLLVAFHPKTTRFTPAIVADTGPADNLGEGSVFLNMTLLGTTVPPTNKAETFKLAISDTEVLIAILPGTRSFQVVKPFEADNIDARVRRWQQDAGFTTPEQFIELMKSFQPKLR
jgi:hypothetical protein